MAKLYMGTTEISTQKTASQIQELLAKKGVRQILMEYEEGEVSAMNFMMELPNGRPIPYRLPVRWNSCYSLMTRGQRIRPASIPTLQAQAKRTAWRIILRWLEAQIALIETGMASLEEVMLPYIHCREGQTFYEVMVQDKYQAIPDHTGGR